MPNGFCAAHKVTGVPPVIGTFRSWLLDQKAIHAPSGENTGSAGSDFSVPAIGEVLTRSCRAVQLLIRDIHEARAVRRQGHDMPAWASEPLIVREYRLGSCDDRWRGRLRPEPPRHRGGGKGRASHQRSGQAQYARAHGWPRRRDCVANRRGRSGALRGDPFSCRITSRADCQRSSGSLASERRTSRSGAARRRLSDATSVGS